MPAVQPRGALRTQASALSGVAAAAVIVPMKVAVHPAPAGGRAVEVQAQSGAAAGGFIHVTPAQVAPVAATAGSSDGGAAAVEAPGHVQVVGKGFDGTIAKAQAAVALHTEPAAPVA